jgi:hypothetical protein
MKFEIGNKVKVIGNTSGSNNKVDDIGIITETDMIDNDPDRLCYRVTVEGRFNLANWHYTHELEIIKE